MRRWRLGVGWAEAFCPREAVDLVASNGWWVIVFSCKAELNWKLTMWFKMFAWSVGSCCWNWFNVSIPSLAGSTFLNPSCFSTPLLITSTLWEVFDWKLKFKTGLSKNYMKLPMLIIAKNSFFIEIILLNQNFKNIIRMLIYIWLFFIFGNLTFCFLNFI